jgi:hypothetical protein
MTEQEWLQSKVPVEMLYHLKATGSIRQFLLFACACERRFWNQPDCERDKVVAVERYADGDGPAEELLAALEAIGIDGVSLEIITEMAPTKYAWLESQRYAEYAANLAAGSWNGSKRNELVWQPALDAEKAEQCALLRDIFGNPFRPVLLDPRWQTPAVVALARTIYEERRFQEMPVLADALEEAGCTDKAILAHCREPGEHVRGCWVLDLVLGRE